MPLISSCIHRVLAEDACRVASVDVSREGFCTPWTCRADIHRMAQSRRAADASRRHLFTMTYYGSQWCCELQPHGRRESALESAGAISRPSSSESHPRARDLSGAVATRFGLRDSRIRRAARQGKGKAPAPLSRQHRRRRRCTAFLAHDAARLNHLVKRSTRTLVVPHHRLSRVGVRRLVGDNGRRSGFKTS